MGKRDVGRFSRVRTKSFSSTKHHDSTRGIIAHVFYDFLREGDCETRGVSCRLACYAWGQPGDRRGVSVSIFTFALVHLSKWSGDRVERRRFKCGFACPLVRPIALEPEVSRTRPERRHVDRVMPIRRGKLRRCRSRRGRARIW